RQRSQRSGRVEHRLAAGRVDEQVGAAGSGEGQRGREGHPQTSAAVSTMRRSLATSSSKGRAVPSTVEEKPHWGERQIWSRGTYWAASSMRRLRVSLDSSSPRLVVTRPRTTILPGGTKRSGAKPPERGSSYSRKKPSTASSENRASATKSYPPDAAHEERKLPRHRCVVTASPEGFAASAALTWRM